jgi:CCR4-NOT transcriptional regulation complex NOT5 subunit
MLGLFMAIIEEFYTKVCGLVTYLLSLCRRNQEGDYDLIRPGMRKPISAVDLEEDTSGFDIQAGVPPPSVSASTSSTSSASAASRSSTRSKEKEKDSGKGKKKGAKADVSEGAKIRDLDELTDEDLELQEMEQGTTKQKNQGRAAGAIRAAAAATAASAAASASSSAASSASDNLKAFDPLSKQ